tara:strand:+ start:77 stop:1261 length:1185 start_codon:yes stop_codon:yes gene_type:complete
MNKSKNLKNKIQANQAPGENTLSIHNERSFAEATGSVMPPIFTTSTFSHGNKEGFDYTRSGNPNFQILENVLNSIEKSKYTTVFASGVSAVTAIVSSLKSGDTVLCEENLYGCTVRLFEEVFKKFGVKTESVDFSNKNSFDLIRENRFSLIWIESPTNPLLKIIDIRKICEEAKKVKIPVVVDNTFCTALIQKPLELGASLSLTSTTKYINGHSDALGGSISTNNKEWNKKLKFAQKSLGLQPSPFDTWLITRGIKTLPLRLEKQVNNAFRLASLLSGNKSINSLRYPFDPYHPHINVAKSQMKSGGAIITANLKGSKKNIFYFCKNLRYFTLAESLGGIESLVCHPATMTHASVSSEVKLKLGINDSLVRFSIGCEDFEDLKFDLIEGLKNLS